MKRKEYRKLSNSSRLWIVFEELYPPFAIQMTCEGTGSFDVKSWHEAVREASEVNPGSRLILKGLLNKARWVDTGINPVVREADANGWDGSGSENAPFLWVPLNHYKGPTCEVLLLHGDPNRVFFRAHHAVMDARGVTTWAEDIFRVLRGEKPLGSEFQLTEDDLLNVSHEKIERPIPHWYKPPTGRPTRVERGCLWRRKRIKGSFSKLMPQCMLLIAREAFSNGADRVRIGVPVDLRSRREDLRSTSNLTNAIFLDIPRDSSVDEISAIISKRLENKIDGTLTWEDKILPIIPLKILKKAIQNETLRSIKSGNYRNSAVVSNLGKMDPRPFNGGGFTCENIFFIPQGTELLPLFLVMTGNTDGVDLTLSIPKNLADNGRIEKAFDRIISGIQ